MRRLRQFLGRDLFASGNMERAVERTRVLNGTLNPFSAGLTTGGVVLYPR